MEPLTSSQPIKILYIIGTLNIGGAETQLVQLVEKIDRAKFEPVICCLSEGGPLLKRVEAAHVDCQVLGIGKSPNAIYNFLRGVLQLIKFMRRGRFAIAHGHMYHAYVIGGLCARLTSIPIVVASRWTLKTGAFKERGTRLLLERFVNRVTDLILVNSEALREEVLTYEKAPSSRIGLIYSGVDLSSFGPREPPPALKDSLGIPKKAKVVGVVANLHRYKGHEFFVHACQRVKSEFRDVKFLLIGEGVMRKHLEVLVRELGLQEEVLFLSSRQDIADLLCILDIAVLPSLEEAFPNVILEAMAAGKPVVATAVGGNPEAVIHGETGLLVPPGDSQALAEAMLWLLEHPTEAARFGEAGGRRVAERFEISAMVRHYEGVYEQLVAEKCPERFRAERSAGKTVSRAP